MVLDVAVFRDCLGLHLPFHGSAWENGPRFEVSLSSVLLMSPQDRPDVFFCDSRAYYCPLVAEKLGIRVVFLSIYYNNLDPSGSPETDFSSLDYRARSFLARWVVLPLATIPSALLWNRERFRVGLPLDAGEIRHFAREVMCCIRSYLCVRISLNPIVHAGQLDSWTNRRAVSVLHRTQPRQVRKLLESK